MEDYRSVLYTNYSAHFGGKKNQFIENQFRVYHKIYSGVLHEKDWKVGDLGCGKGEWLRWMTNKGHQNLVGIDRSTNELEFLSGEDIELRDANVLKGIGKNEFDLLHAKDLFEHFSKDEAVSFLKSSFAALKPGGQLWILTFNAQSPLANITRYGDFTHELGVTPQSMAQVLRAVGFEHISVNGYFPRPLGYKGFLREFIGKLFLLPMLGWMRIRHGSGSSQNLSSLYPDLFAIAYKPEK